MKDGKELIYEGQRIVRKIAPKMSEKPLPRYRSYYTNIPRLEEGGTKLDELPPKC